MFWVFGKAFQILPTIKGVSNSWSRRSLLWSFIISWAHKPHAIWHRPADTPACTRSTRVPGSNSSPTKQPLCYGSPGLPRATVARSCLCAQNEKKSEGLHKKQLPLFRKKNSTKPQLYLLLIITNSFWVHCIIIAKPFSIHKGWEHRLRFSHTAWEGCKCYGSFFNVEVWLCAPGAEERTILHAATHSLLVCAALRKQGPREQDKAWKSSQTCTTFHLPQRLLGGLWTGQGGF